MFFSAKQFMSWANSSRSNYTSVRYNYGHEENIRYVGSREALVTYSQEPLTLKECQHILRKVKDAIADRDVNRYQMLGKWYRPWAVVPELINWRAPAGDFGVGVEVEMGFRDRAAARIVANHIKHWKYVAIDYEGGHDPIEATFAPIRYSKLSSKSQVIRYLKYLNTVRNLVVNHSNNNSVGTHVNVSVGDHVTLNNFGPRLREVNTQLSNICSRRDQYGDMTGTSESARKYFGRYPYGWGSLGSSRFIEWKLFNSQLDPKRLVQYIDIAVALTKLVVTTSIPVTQVAVLAALEEGYNKRSRKRKTEVSLVAEPSIIAMAQAA